MIDWHFWVSLGRGLSISKNDNQEKNTDKLLTGRRILELQTSLALLQSPAHNNPSSASSSGSELDSYGRTPFTTPSTQNIEAITPVSKHSIASPVRLARLAESYGLKSVIRWKPRQVRNLKSSGLDTVLAQSVYAIVGAVALQKGGEAAAEVVRKSILAPLMGN